MSCWLKTIPAMWSCSPKPSRIQAPRYGLHAVSDGIQAMRFLRQAGGFTTAPRPGLILLDLRLPGRSGLDVLAEIKTDPGLLPIPVVVLTSSDAREDIQRSYALHANAYVAKPADFNGYAGVIHQIAACFVDLIELPR
jgi:CheY-like chemotaxis protein